MLRKIRVFHNKGQGTLFLLAWCHFWKRAWFCHPNQYWSNYGSYPTGSPRVNKAKVNLELKFVSNNTWDCINTVIVIFEPYLEYPVPGSNRDQTSRPHRPYIFESKRLLFVPGLFSSQSPGLTWPGYNRVLGPANGRFTDSKCRKIVVYDGLRYEELFYGGVVLRSIRRNGALTITASGQMRILCAIASPASVSDCQKSQKVSKVSKAISKPNSTINGSATSIIYQF